MKISGKMIMAVLCQVSVALYSCKKTTEEYPTPSTPPPAPRVKTIDYLNGYSEKYYYNEMWRINTIIYIHSGKSYEKLTYQYNDGNIVRYDYDSTGKLFDTVTYTLNTDKLVAIRYSTQGGNTDYYTYNSNRQELSDSAVFSKRPGTTIRYLYYYSNGNVDSVTSSVTTNGSVTSSGVTYYDNYFTDKQNTIGNENVGMLHFGYSSVNPFKSSRSMSSTGQLSSFGWQYEYDQQSRIIKQTATNAITGTQGVKTFTYY